ncbi:MAG TPA: O-antigen ligase family protein, partial [Tepidisphaeraceae bacterium]|nr:O-antigen ligase family protein [Tepidisphaeraceae bacterium]
MQSSNIIGFQFNVLISFLLSPLGILSLLLVPVAVIVLLSSSAARWTALALLLWLSTFGVVVELPWFKSVLMFPLEDLRKLAKSLCIILMLLMIPAAMFSATTGRTKHPIAASWAYFFFLLVITLRIMSAGYLDRAATQFLTVALTFLIFGIGVPRWIQNVDDIRRALKCITWAGLLLVVCTLMQVVVDSKQVILVGRLYGVTGNPQFLGSVMGLCLTPALCLLLESRESKLWRLTLAGTIGFMIVCMVWAGSRTGVLGAGLNILLFFRLRLGKIFVGAIIVALSLWVALQFFSESFAGADRLFSTTDTRSEAWSSMYDSFLRNPVLGSVGEGFGYQENTYLAVASQFGIVGILPGLLVIVLAINTIRKLLLVRSRLGTSAVMCDVVFSGLVALAVICMFDAYPLAIVGFHVFFLYIY